ncbi:MAG: hypothetical protein ACJ718_04860 [Nitrososphaeraceae archaeon]
MKIIIGVFFTFKTLSLVETAWAHFKFFGNACYTTMIKNPYDRRVVIELNDPTTDGKCYFFAASWSMYSLRHVPQTLNCSWSLVVLLLTICSSAIRTPHNSQF